MKKLMFAAAAMLAGSMFAIESANIVGYQEIDVPAGYSLYTVTFKDVSGADLDIQGMRVIKDGAELSTTAEVTLQGMTVAGAYDSTQAYNWRTRSGKTGWHKNATYLNGVVNQSAQAWCVNNKTGGAVKFRIAGSVELVPVTNELPVGYGLFGNMTPAAIDIQDMRVLQNGVELGTTAEVTLQAMTTAGAYDSTRAYNWRTRSGKTGWHKNATYLSGVLLQPGEAFCLNNKSAAPITLKFKSPITE